MPPSSFRLCRHKHCSKCKRVGSFCAKHASAKGVKAKPRTPIPRTTRLRFPCTHAPSGCCRKVILPQHILSALDQLPKGMRLDSPHYNDRRCVVSVDESAKEADMYNTIPTFLSPFISKISKPLILESAVLVIAPAKSQRLPQFREGPANLHRDTDSDSAGHYTLLTCLTDVTKDNGSVTFYPDTQCTTLNEKHRETSVTGKQSITLTGERGTGWLFDSRLLH